MVTIDNNAQPVPDKSYEEPAVGLIVPPPEIRSIVEKTAQFVARNGENFEHKIRQNEMNNPKFNFLKDEDPYNGYYKHKVSVIQDIIMLYGIKKISQTILIDKLGIVIDKTFEYLIFELDVYHIEEIPLLHHLSAP